MTIKKDYIDHIIKNIPHEPGIYRMKDADKKIIYIGKAKDLKKRITSYFKDSTEKDDKTKIMLEQAEDIDYVIVQSELEALMLETNMIKEFRPKYNILMKDDKNYVYVKITTNEDYPRIFITRQIDKDKATYFGPKTAQHKVVKTLKVLKRIFPFRHCHLCIDYVMPLKDLNKHQVTVKKASIKYPCIDFHIQRCPGPCVGNVSKDEYRKYIDQIIGFFEGKYEIVLENLKKEMMKAASEKKFESAAAIRDKISSIEEILQKQDVSAPDHQNSDVINFAKFNERLFFNLFQVREGKLINQENFEFVSKGDQSGINTADNALKAFIEQYYEKATDIPKEVLIPAEIEDRDTLAEWLSELNGHKVTINIPQRGRKEHLLELAYRNAESFAKLTEIKWQGNQKNDRDEALENLQKILSLPKTPKRIECYDISHHGGTETVASMTVFESGFPKKEFYRKFRLHQNTPGRPDDFLSMKETLTRRLKYLKPSLGMQEIKLKKLTAKDKIAFKNSLQNDSAEKYFVFDCEKNRWLIFAEQAEKRRTIIKFPEYFKINDKNSFLRKIKQKFKCTRLYLEIPNDNSSEWLEEGFQQLKNIPDFVMPQSCNTVLVLDMVKIKEDASFTKTPDLIVIDGGKGQLGVVCELIKTSGFSIPIIGLAKKNEEIFLPEKKSPVMLEKTSPALHLLQHIRDEAHRFAVDYHENVYLKKLKHSILDDIVGIGDKKRNLLINHFGSALNVKNASLFELEKVVGKKTALLLKKKLN